MSANRTPNEKRMASLALANSIRVRRKELKEQLRCRHINIVAVLMDPPQCCETAAVGDVLRWAPTVGAAKAEVVLRRLRMPASVRLGSLADSRRRQLVVELADRYPAQFGQVAS